MTPDPAIWRYAAAFFAGALLFVPACAADSGALAGKSLGRFPMSLKYVLTLLAGGALAVVCAVCSGFSLQTLVRFVFLALLAAVALTDFDTMEIPDGLCAAAGIIGIASYFLLPGPSLLSRAIGIFCVSVPLAVIALLVEGAFGGGDIKLMAACGIFLGWRDTLLAAFIGILLGGVWGAALLITKKKKGGEHFAFGPCLCAGMALCTFFGDAVARLFLNIFDLSRFF